MRALLQPWSPRETAASVTVTPLLVLLLVIVVVHVPSASAAESSSQQHVFLLAFQQQPSRKRTHFTTTYAGGIGNTSTDNAGSSTRLGYSIGPSNDENQSSDPATATARMTSASDTSTAKKAAPSLPTLNNYSIDSNGRVVGLIRNHPTLPDAPVHLPTSLTTIMTMATMGGYQSRKPVLIERP